MRIYVPGAGAAAQNLAVLHHISTPFNSCTPGVIRFSGSVCKAGGLG